MIGILNLSEKHFKYIKSKLPNIINLSKENNIPNNLDFVFIRWIGSSYKGKNKEVISNLLKQTQIIEKNIKTIIFDYRLAITEKEFSFLKKKKHISFFEPALNYRKGFSFLPNPVLIPSSIDYLSIIEKTVDLCYPYNISDKISSFQKYILNFSSLYPEYKVVCGPDPPKEKKDFYVSNNIIFEDCSYKESKTSILINTNFNHKIGYLENLENLLDNFCVPLIPEEHRFYHSVFDNLTIKKMSDIKYIIDFINKTDYHVMIEDFYKNLVKFLPESSLDYLISILKGELS